MSERGYRVEPESFEERLQRRLQEDLEDLLGDSRAQPLPQNVTVDEIRVEGRYPDAEIVILFRDRKWSECRFGYRWRFADEEDAWLGDSDYFIPMLTWAYLTELILAEGSPYHHSPRDCAGDEVIWFSWDIRRDS